MTHDQKGCKCGDMKGIKLVRKRMKETGQTMATIGATFGLTRQAVSAWPRVPKKYHEEVALLLDVPKEDVRPDLYIDYD